MRRIVVLGSTGSIGTQTLDVVRQHPDKLKIVGLAVNTRAQDMLAQAKEFGVGHLAWAAKMLLRAKVPWILPRLRNPLEKTARSVLG